METKQRSLQVSMPDHLRAGISSNVVRVTTTDNREVILDFVFMHPQDVVGDVQQAILVSRVVLPEKVAKDLHVILEKHLGKIVKE